MRLGPFVLRSSEQVVVVARLLPFVDLELASIVVATIAAGESAVRWLSVHLVVAPFQMLSLVGNREELFNIVGYGSW